MVGPSASPGPFPCRRGGFLFFSSSRRFPPITPSAPSPRELRILRPPGPEAPKSGQAFIVGGRVHPTLGPGPDGLGESKVTYNRYINTRPTALAPSRVPPVRGGPRRRCPVKRLCPAGASRTLRQRTPTGATGVIQDAGSRKSHPTVNSTVSGIRRGKNLVCLVAGDQPTRSTPAAHGVVPTTKARPAIQQGCHLLFFSPQRKPSPVVPRHRRFPRVMPVRRSPADKGPVGRT